MVAISPLMTRPGGKAFTATSASRVRARRRVVAALLLFGFVGALAGSGTFPLDGAGPSVGAVGGAGSAVALAARPVAATVHIVQPGETLWTIARSIQPTGDVRPLVAQLAKSVGDTQPLHPGQRVTVPG